MVANLLTDCGIDTGRSDSVGIGLHDNIGGDIDI